MTAIWSAVKRQSQGSLTSAIRSGQHSRNWFTGSAPEYRWKTSSAPQGAAVTVRILLPILHGQLIVVPLHPLDEITLAQAIEERKLHRDDLIAQLRQVSVPQPASCRYSPWAAKGDHSTSASVDQPS